MPAPRVDLRPVTRADRDVLIAAHRDSHDHHRPWVTPFIDEPGFHAWFDRRFLGRDVTLLAHHGDTLVGVVSLTEIVLGPLRGAYLGFYGMRAAARRGLMTDAVRAALRHGFDDLGLHRIEANIQPAKARSIALVRRLGFRREGLSTDYLFLEGAWRDCERWAILDRELDLGVDAPLDPPIPRTPDTDRFWRVFCTETGLADPAVYDLIAFGHTPAERDDLAALVLARRKRATASLRRDYHPGLDRVPAPGDLNLVTNAAGTPACVIRTTDVRLGRLDSVDPAFAWEEGEGDRTPAAWLAIHRAFFAPVEDDADTIFERFTVIWPDLPPGAGHA